MQTNYPCLSHMPAVIGAQINHPGDVRPTGTLTLTTDVLPDDEHLVNHTVRVIYEQPNPKYYTKYNHILYVKLSTEPWAEPFKNLIYSVLNQAFETIRYTPFAIDSFALYLANLHISIHDNQKACQFLHDLTTRIHYLEQTNENLDELEELKQFNENSAFIIESNIEFTPHMNENNLRTLLTLLEDINPVKTNQFLAQYPIDVLTAPPQVKDKDPKDCTYVRDVFDMYD